MSTAKQQVERELDELSVKIIALAGILDNPIGRSKIPIKQITLLYIQHNTMLAYKHTLTRRLEEWI